jgi:hypothetical protein
VGRNVHHYNKLQNIFKFSRRSYYRWKKPIQTANKKPGRKTIITEESKFAIEWIKSYFPEMHAREVRDFVKVTTGQSLKEYLFLYQRMLHC